MPDSLVDQLFYPLERSNAAIASTQPATASTANLPETDDEAVVEMAARIETPSKSD